MLKGLYEKGVGGFFSGNGGGGAVAGVDRRVLGEGENFFANARKELIPVAPRKIPAADPIRKENIAAEKLVGGGKIKAETAGAVPGNEQEFGSRPCVRNRV